MSFRTAALSIASLALVACGTTSSAPPNPTGEAHIKQPAGGSAPGFAISATQPLTIGETFSIDSRVMGEARRINVLIPSVYGQKVEAPMPVLYMLDGGLDEDFLHIAGLMQVLVSNGGMRPFILVGIQNTARRRDLTGPTTSAEDKKIAPVVGGSATFRRFIKEELMPAVRSRYRTTGETAIVGESLAGLFVVETLLLEPDLFASYIAFDPSLWWANEELLNSAAARLAAAPARRKSVFIACGNGPETLKLTGRLAAAIEARRDAQIDFHFIPFPAETHATVYHPAALLAFRTVFAPPVPDAK